MFDLAKIISIDNIEYRYDVQLLNCVDGKLYSCGYGKYFKTLQDAILYAENNAKEVSFRDFGLLYKITTEEQAAQVVCKVFDYLINKSKYYAEKECSDYWEHERNISKMINYEEAAERALSLLDKIEMEL